MDNQFRIQFFIELLSSFSLFLRMGRTKNAASYLSREQVRSLQMIVRPENLKDPAAESYQLSPDGSKLVKLNWKKVYGKNPDPVPVPSSPIYVSTTGTGAGAGAGAGMNKYLVPVPVPVPVLFKLWCRCRFQWCRCRCRLFQILVPVPVPVRVRISFLAPV